jgi:hypothetical protein
MYLRYKIAKEMWDTLNTEYRGLDAGTELYIIEQYHDYQMVDGKSVVMQAHEIQCMVKELELLKIIVLDEYVAGGIIAKLPPSSRDFAIALKHNRVHISISDLIASLDVRRKLGLRTDDLKELRVKPVPTWCTSHSHMAKTKAKLSTIRITTSQSKLLPLRRRRIRRMMVASCADLWIIGQRSIQIAKEENLNLSRRLRTWLYPALEMELVGTVIYPMFFQCFNLPPSGLILVQTFMCVLMLRYSLLTRSLGILP